MTGESGGIEWSCFLLATRRFLVGRALPAERCKSQTRCWWETLGCAAPAKNEILTAPRASPSPGAPGEGWGEGHFLLSRKNPPPNPLPEYREREPEQHSSR